ncbi:tetratricopeptide repeat protein [Halobellus ruber]|uniref:Tetratricopeptide repeat protein n=1 Tax=Halobellus ruber TaxID=2761102 RepID=A0A7J9SG91_9EURY|nr:tetratricopeptide repeat protein [Halobellus ruber]MBB6644987.1 tetratricopeptide repeat protein [Halobellus ruber]
MSELSTEFNKILRDELITQLRTIHPNVSEADIRKNWDVVADELGEVQFVFESETDTVHRIASAVTTGLTEGAGISGVDVEDVEPIVADVYRRVLTQFNHQVAGTELADVLSQEADLELSRSVKAMNERLQEYERRLDRVQQAELKNQGFVHLSDTYFTRYPPAQPEKCWRTGFELPEVNAGYAVSREAGSSDGDRFKLSEKLTESLKEGTDCALLGPSGSGKSTVCKEVACQWYEERRGDVFYRESDRSAKLNERGILEEQIVQAEGSTLVVVEDAIREEAKNIFYLIDRFRNDDSVAFLLDSRDSEWHRPDIEWPTHRLREIKESDLEIHTLPRIDRRECERIIEHFERTTDSTVPDSPDEIYEEVASSTGVGEMLQLSYHLSFYTLEPEVGDQSEKGVTSLANTVQNVIMEQESSDDDHLSLKFGILLNLLNAADVGVRTELLYVLAEDEEDHRRINELLKQYEGILVFSTDEEVITDQTGTLRTTHEFWSTLYLQELPEIIGERDASWEFFGCLKALFGIFDSAEERRQIRRRLRQRNIAFFEQIDDRPRATADNIVESIYRLGQRQPGLSRLYGETGLDGTDHLPDVCTPSIAPKSALWKGVMHFRSGNFKLASDESEEASRLLEDIDNIPEGEKKQIKGRCWNCIGASERERGEIDKARRHVEESIRMFEEVDDDSGVASARFHLGRIHWVESDFECALDQLERALDVFRDREDSRSISTTLNTIGLVHRDLSNFDEAERRLQDSRENAKEAGDERSEARALNHLGEVERYQSNYSDAQSYYKQGRKKARKVGDIHCEAWLVHNLGTIKKRQGELDEALERFEQARTIKEEMGNKRGIAISSNYAATVHSLKGEYDEALEKVDRGIEILTEIEDDRRLGELVRTKGVVAKNRGNLDLAEQKISESLSIFEDLDERKWRADSLIELGSVLVKRLELDTAEELFREAHEIKQEISDEAGTSRALGGLGLVSEYRGDYDEAVRRYTESGAIAQEVNDVESRAYVLSRLGSVARRRGQYEVSRACLEESKRLFSEMGNTRRKARVNRLLGDTALATGRYDRAEEQYLRALDTFEDIGDRYGRARCHFGRGKLALKREEPDSARDLFRKSMTHFESAGATTRGRRLLQGLDDDLEDVREL